MSLVFAVHWKPARDHALSPNILIFLGGIKKQGEPKVYFGMKNGSKEKMKKY